MSFISFPSSIQIPKIGFGQKRVAWGLSVEDGKVVSPTQIPRQKKHIPKVACAFGRRGDGKTLWMSSVARIERLRNDAAGTNFGILSNYELEYADRSGQELVHELQEFPEWLGQWDYKLILIDEIADIIPSARGMSNNNLLTISFLRMLRKLGCSVIVGTQFPQEVSMGMLRQVDYFIRCKSVAEGRAIDTFWWDWPGNITGNWGRKYWPPQPETHDWSFRYHNTYLAWGSYRTEEIIAPHHINEASMNKIREREAKAGKEFLEREVANPSTPIPVDAGGFTEFVGEHETTPVAAGAPTDTSFREMLMSVGGSGVGYVDVNDVLPAMRTFTNNGRLTMQGALAMLRAQGFHVDKNGAIAL